MALAKPNFSRPDTLKLYGKSVLAKDHAATESIRWQMAEADPASSFAAARLLEFYQFGQSTCSEMTRNKRLNEFLGPEAKRAIL